MEPVITGIARTPIGRYGGALAPVRAVELGGRVIAGALERSGIEPGLVDEVIFGQVLQAAAPPGLRAAAQGPEPGAGRVDHDRGVTGARADSA